MGIATISPDLNRTYTFQPVQNFEYKINTNLAQTAFMNEKSTFALQFNDEQ